MAENVVSEIIYQLLSESKKVSLAGLGYFEVDHQSASYNTAKKALQPPVDKINFKNTFESIDNLLEVKVAEKLNITTAKASEKIAAWVEDVCAQLAEKGKADLGALGSFNVDNDGKIIFNLADGTNRTKDNYGLGEVKIERML